MKIWLCPKIDNEDLGPPTPSLKIEEEKTYGSEGPTDKHYRSPSLKASIALEDLELKQALKLSQVMIPAATSLLFLHQVFSHHHRRI